MDACECEHLLSIWGLALEVELLSHLVILCFTFEDPSNGHTNYVAGSSVRQMEAKSLVIKNSGVANG